MNSTDKYYGTILVILEFYSFDQQTSAHFVSEVWVPLSHSLRSRDNSTSRLQRTSFLKYWVSLNLFNRQDKRNNRAGRMVIFHADLAVVIRNNGTDNSQPQTGARFFC